jgi:transcriptional regulator with XRE-family HTH domain
MMDGFLEAKHLAARLRRVRLERGLSLRGAATETGVTKETLSDLERARRHPHPPTLAKIADGYGVEISDLLGPMVEEESVDLGKVLALQ